MIDWDRIRQTYAPLIWSTVARILKHHDDALDCFQDVVVRTIDLTSPLAQLETRLDLVDAEIAELRNKAALLEARKMADEMLVQY